MVGVGVGDQDGVGGAELLEAVELGQRAAGALGAHADAGVDEEPLTGDLQHCAGGADFAGSAEEVKAHVPVGFPRLAAPLPSEGLHPPQPPQ